MSCREQSSVQLDMSIQTYTTSAAIPSNLTLAAMVETVENFKREFPDPKYQGFFVSPFIECEIKCLCVPGPQFFQHLTNTTLDEFRGLKMHVRSWMPNDRVIPIPFRLTEKFEDFEARARAQVEIDK